MREVGRRPGQASWIRPEDPAINTAIPAVDREQDRNGSSTYFAPSVDLHVVRAFDEEHLLVLTGGTLQEVVLLDLLPATIGSSWVKSTSALLEAS